MEESQSKNSQNKSAELQEQLQLSPSNKHSSFIDNKHNSSPKNNLSSPHSKHSNIKEENTQSKDLSSHHSSRSKNNDSLVDNLNENPNQIDEDANLENHSSSTNISDVDIISDVSGEIVPKSKLLKMYREEHNNKIKKTKKILRDADYRHAQYGSRKKSRSNPRSKASSNPNLDSNKAILNSIPESIKQSPGILAGGNNTNTEDLNIKARSVSIGSLNDQENNNYSKTNSQKSNENNSDKKSPKSNQSFSSHTSKFTNGKLSPVQQPENNSLENIASYNSSTHSEESPQQKHKHHSRRKHKRPHLVLSPVQCNNFFSNSNNLIKTRSINNNPNSSPSDGQNFQFTPPSKLNSNKTKSKNDTKGTKKLETHFSSNLMPNSSIDFETVNAAPEELLSSSSFVTEPIYNAGSSHLKNGRESEHQLNDSSLSEVSMNFTTEPLNFSQAEEFSTVNNSEIYNNNSYSINKRNNPKSKPKNNHNTSIKSNSITQKNREASSKSNQIIERNVPHLLNKNSALANSIDESKLYTYTYETIDASESRSWTYMSVYDYEYEEETNNKNDKNEQNKKGNKRNREILVDDNNNYSRSDKHQSQSGIRESESNKSGKRQNSSNINESNHSSNLQSFSGLKENDRSSKHQSLSGIKENENDRSSKHQSLSGLKDNENDRSSKHQSLSGLKENENDRSSKHQSLSGLKENENDRSSKHQSLSGIKDNENDRSSKHQSLSGLEDNENDRSSKHQSLSGIKDSEGERSRRSMNHQSQPSDNEIENDQNKRNSANRLTPNERSYESRGSSLRNKVHNSSFHDNEQLPFSDSNNTTPPIKERSIPSELTPSPRIEEMKHSLDREIKRYHASPRITISSSDSSQHQERSPRLSTMKLNESSNKDSDFHFENGKKIDSDESFTEIFDKCRSDSQSNSVVVVLHAKNSTKDEEQIHLSSIASHISQSEDDHDPNEIRNISQIPEDTVKRSLPNPSRDEILYLSENFDENQTNNNNIFDENKKIEQSLSLASSESASHYSSSSNENEKKKSKLVLNKASNISREIRSFSVHDIEKIAKEEEEEEKEEEEEIEKSNSSTIVPRKIDFASNSNSSKESKSSQNRQKMSPRSPRKTEKEEQSKKPIFPAFNLPSNQSSTTNHTYQSFESFDRISLDDDMNEKNSSSSLFNSYSSSFSIPFNTLRVTIVEAQTQEEESEIDVQMFIASDRRNIASTEISMDKKNSHVFRETFNIALDDLKENLNNSLFNQESLGDLCILLRQKKNIIARTVIPISMKTFKIGRKVDRWYQLVPNGKIRIIAMAVDQMNRSFSSSNNNSKVNSIIENDVNSNSSQIRIKNQIENKLDKSQNLNDSNNVNEGVDEIDVDFEVVVDNEIEKKDSVDKNSDVDNDGYNSTSISEDFDQNENEKKNIRVSNFKPFNHEGNSDDDDDDNDEVENNLSFGDTLASVLN